MDPYAMYYEYDSPTRTVATSSSDDFQQAYNPAAVTLAPLQPALPELSIPIDPEILEQDEQQISKASQATETELSQQKITIRLNGSIYEAIKLPKDLPVPEEVIDVERSKVANPPQRNNEKRRQGADYCLPRVRVKKIEMDAIRPSHKLNPKPTFKGKSENYASSIIISLSEVDALNEYRRSHDGAQVVLNHKKENDPVFCATRAKVSAEYDINIARKAASKAERNASRNDENNM